MNFTTQLNPSTKCREVFSVDEATGASAKVAVIPAGVDPVYVTLIETACSVAMRMKPTAPHVPLDALPELLSLVHMSRLLDDAAFFISCKQKDRAMDLLGFFCVMNTAEGGLAIARHEFDERRRAVLDKLKGVHAPK